MAQPGEMALLLLMENDSVSLCPRVWAALKSVCRLTRVCQARKPLVCDTYHILKLILRAPPTTLLLSRCALSVRAPTLLFAELVRLAGLCASVRARRVALRLPDDEEDVKRLELAGPDRARAEEITLSLGFFNRGWLALLRRASLACRPSVVRALDSARWSLHASACAADELADAVPLFVVAVAVPPYPDAPGATLAALQPRLGRLRVESLRLWPDAACGRDALQKELREAMGPHLAPHVLPDPVSTRY